MADRPSRLARGAVIASLMVLLSATLLSAEPRRPSDDTEILARLPAGAQRDDERLRGLHAALRDDPNDLSLALRTARGYISLARRQSDPRFRGYARAALAPWWALDDPPREVRVLRAVLRQAEHDFAAALADLEAVLTAAPAHVQARLAQAMILRAQGKPVAARESCAALARRVPRLVRTICLSATASLAGAAEASYRQLARGLETAGAADGALQVWGLTVLGEIARQLGREAEAERHFRAGLALAGDDSALRGALADLLLDQGRAAEVRALIPATETVDALLLRRLEAALRLGDPRAETDIAALTARFEAGRRRGTAAHLREEARFTLRVLGRSEAALRLAEENWRRQREPADARLLLEAAIAAGAPEAARPVLTWLRETGFESARIESLTKEL